MRERLICGKLLKARGLKGEIAVRASADEPERFLSLRTCRAVTEEGECVRELRIVHASLSGNQVFLRFDGINSREEAEKLTGLYLSIPRELALPLGENSWYSCDLEGSRVVDRQRGLLGTVAEISSNGVQDLLRVCKNGEPDIYIPVLRRILKRVDIAAGTLELELPDGLYEVYREVQEENTAREV